MKSFRETQSEEIFTWGFLDLFKLREWTIWQLDRVRTTVHGR